MATNKRKRHSFIIFVLLVIVIIALAMSSGSTHKGHRAAGHRAGHSATAALVPKYTVVLVSVTDPPNPTAGTTPTPKTIFVVFRVTNTGTAAGAPRCSIKATATTGAYGFTSATATAALKPRTTATYHVRLRITTTRAGRITKTEVKVSCS